MPKQFTYRVPASASKEFNDYIAAQIENYGSFPKFVTTLIEASLAGKDVAAMPSPTASVPATPVLAPEQPEPVTAESLGEVVVEVDADAIASKVAKSMAPLIDEKIAKPLGASIMKTQDAAAAKAAKNVADELREQVDGLEIANNDYMAALVNRIDIVLDYVEKMVIADTSAASFQESYIAEDNTVFAQETPFDRAVDETAVTAPSPFVSVPAAEPVAPIEQAPVVAVPEPVAVPLPQEAAPEIPEIETVAKPAELSSRTPVAVNAPVASVPMEVETVEDEELTQEDYAAMAADAELLSGAKLLLMGD